LTDILNNEQAWVREWLQLKMVDLNRELEAIGDVGFHLKGGRALYYVLRQPELGKNDWDTSVLIDPALGSRAWYAKLREVHNLTLKRLQRYKREFFVIAHKPENIASMKASQEKKPSAAPAELDGPGLEHLGLVGEADRVEDHAAAGMPLEPVDAVGVHPAGRMLFPAYRAGTKAERIDIGIPRRDTPQSVGHWHEIIAPGVILKPWTEDIPVPAHRYYIDEYLMMVRGAFDTPQKKVEKRVTRLVAMLKIGDQDDDPEVNMNRVVQDARARVHGGMLDASLAAVDGLALAEKRLLTVLLEEFWDAYGLSWKTGLAGAFDEKFQTYLNDEGYVEYSKSIEECREGLRTTCRSSSASDLHTSWPTSLKHTSRAGLRILVFSQVTRKAGDQGS